MRHIHLTQKKHKRVKALEVSGKMSSGNRFKYVFNSQKRTGLPCRRAKLLQDAQRLPEHAGSGVQPAFLPDPLCPAQPLHGILLRKRPPRLQLCHFIRNRGYGRVAVPLSVWFVCVCVRSMRVCVLALGFRSCFRSVLLSHI